MLHGWLGSWGVWQETMTYLGQYYRFYAIDLWGFGESGKKIETFTVNDYVNLVDQFMERLGIECAPVVGHSMGGTVSLSVAVCFPERVRQVVVIGSPVVGSSLALMLKLAGIRPIAWIVYNAMWALKLGIRLAAPIITSDRRWPNMMDQDLSRTTLESFLTSIASLRKTDLRPVLSKITIPVMGMYGDRDVIVDPKQWQPLLDGIRHTRVERFQRAGHFIMLDEPSRFMQVLKNFLDCPSGVL